MVLLFSAPVIMMSVLTKLFPEQESIMGALSVALLFVILGLICLFVHRIECEEEEEKKLKED
ncbi:hypothetical protein THOM_1654 [Trachipleistophora hominis]|uniref:Transporter n=1 Tax=Trachipleistophora hominis TaxID=72359 RepID=L7JWH9_TRAHO|nr:hypothetical protein THOM_1654 [Trachipleistophora hominis]